MEFSILGPLEVRDGGRAVVLGGTKPRALLAVLLLHASEVVSAERLALALWGEDAPAGAVKTVQVYMSRLRRALGDPDHGHPHGPVHERLRAAFFDPARARMGAEAWDAAVRRGAATSFEEAIAGALAERSPESRRAAAV